MIAVSAAGSGTGLGIVLMITVSGMMTQTVGHDCASAMEAITRIISIVTNEASDLFITILFPPPSCSEPASTRRHCIENVIRIVARVGVAVRCIKP